MTVKELEIIESCFCSFIANSVYLKTHRKHKDDCHCVNKTKCDHWFLKLSISPTFLATLNPNFTGKIEDSMTITETNWENITPVSQWLRYLYLQELKERMNCD